MHHFQSERIGPIAVEVLEAVPGYSDMCKAAKRGVAGLAQAWVEIGVDPRRSAVGILRSPPMISASLYPTA